MSGKKVLLVVIDALASRIVLPAIRAGKLPCLAELIERGTLREECTSIFPSITPAATAAIATGVYPCDHQIGGAFWYDETENSVAYYGDDFWVIIKHGIANFFNDFLIHLNHDRLAAPTLHQRVERNGRTAANLSYMWFRGDTTHQVNPPLLLKLLPGTAVAPEIQGSTVLAIGDFVASKIPGTEERLQAEAGMTRRYGIDDATTAEYLLSLTKADPFPDFTLAYFPNNDFVSHEEGPAEAVRTLENVDQHLREFIDAMGGIDEFLRQFTILITGDHSQCDLIRDESGRGINLNETLDGFQLADAGKTWQESDDLMVCPNLRACHIYVRDRTSTMRDRVIERLLEDPRVDQVCYRGSSWDTQRSAVHIDPRTDSFHVATADRGRLTFRHADKEHQAKGQDRYGTAWWWDGDLSCVDAQLSNSGELNYGAYPNALERIATGFCDLTAGLWVTAKEGCEFVVEETEYHGGGSHGALNTSDSTAPLIVAGMPNEIPIPQHPRTIDVAPLCLQAMGLEEEAAALLRERLAGQPV